MRLFSTLLTGCFLLAGCGNGGGGDAVFYEIVFGDLTSDADCAQGATPTTSHQDNSYSSVQTVQFFDGTQKKYVTKTSAFAGGGAWGANNSVGSTLESKDTLPISMPGLAKIYEGKATATDTRSALVAGASLTVTDIVTMTVDASLDSAAISGTLKLSRDSVCNTSNGTNCPTTWKNNSCTQSAKYQGHRTNGVNKEHFL